MAKTKQDEKSREERVTGNPPLETSETVIPKDSREHHATKGWPKSRKK